MPIEKKGLTPNIKIDQRENIKKMLQEAKMFVRMFKEIISNITEEKIGRYRDQIQSFPIIKR